MFYLLIELRSVGGNVLAKGKYAFANIAISCSEKEISILVEEYLNNMNLLLLEISEIYRSEDCSEYQSLRDTLLLLSDEKNLMGDLYAYEPGN